VFGAVEYARAHGFEPHPDFEACVGHLGPWASPGAIRFGCDGKPRFIQGPYDDPGPIIRSLEGSVGQGNFDFMVGTAELTRRGDPGSAAALAQLDTSELPLVIEAARLAQDPDDETRFLFGLDALLYGFAQWQEPSRTAAK
jgi:hypothetical protein